MKRNIKVLLIALVVLALAGGTFAFAAANTVANPGNAGYKANEIGGYTITNVVYDLKTGDPTKVAKIIFDVAGAPIPVTVLISTTGTKDFTTSTCVVTLTESPYLATCTFATAPDLTDVVSLDIVVSSSTNP